MCRTAGPGRSPLPPSTMLNTAHFQLLLSLLTVRRGSAGPPEGNTPRAGRRGGKGRAGQVCVWQVPLLGDGGSSARVTILRPRCSQGDLSLVSSQGTGVGVPPAGVSPLVSHGGAASGWRTAHAQATASPTSSPPPQVHAMTNEQHLTPVPSITNSHKHLWEPPDRSPLHTQTSHGYPTQVLLPRHTHPMPTHPTPVPSITNSHKHLWEPPVCSPSLPKAE